MLATLPLRAFIAIKMCLLSENKITLTQIEKMSVELFYPHALVKRFEIKLNKMHGRKIPRNTSERSGGKLLVCFIKLGV